MTYWLYPAYVLNIVILVPVSYAMLLGAGVQHVFEGRVTESDGLRIMVGSLWFAILLGSMAGLVWPSFFAPILLLQITYKFVWLLLFILPVWRAGEAYPGGITSVFVLIVACYPVLFWLAHKG